MSAANTPENPDKTHFLRARKEAGYILGAWFLFLVWTIGYAAWYGYDVDIDSMNLVFGIPDWVFWGVFLPWGAATAYSIWFGLCYMKDDGSHE